MDDTKGYPQVICKSCYKEVNALLKFCPHCGTRISEVDITPPPKPKSSEASKTEFETSFGDIKQSVKDGFKDLKDGGEVGEKVSGKAKEKIEEIFSKDKGEPFREKR